MIGGTVDTGLDAIPFVGALKAAVEVARGRDFIPDRSALASRRGPAAGVVSDTARNQSPTDSHRQRTESSSRNGQA